MSAREPFLPVTHVRDEQIDAADPGFGAPGGDTTPDTDEDMQERFEEEMEERRHHPSVFHTPNPAELHGESATETDK